MTTIKSSRTLAKRLRNAEHFDFYDNIVNHLRDTTLKPAGLVPIWDAFVQSFEREDVIYKRYLRLEETRNVQEARDKRQKSLVALKLAVETGLYSDQPQVTEAAASLTKVIDNYAAATHSPMTETSAMIENMIQDLKLPQYAAAVALVLGVSAAIDRLKEDNDAFMDVYFDRASLWEGERGEGSLFDARGQTDQSFARLSEAINVFYQANELQQPKDPDVAATLSAAIHAINTYIHQYETIYARRNAGYHVPKDDAPGEDAPGGGEDAPPAIPQLAIADQEILGEVSGKPKYGLQMSLRAADAEAFAAVLYPEATDGAVHMVGEYEESAFPVADFLMDGDGTTVAGLLVGAPGKMYFNKPFYDGGPAQATVVKDGRILAILTGALYPGTGN